VCEDNGFAASTRTDAMTSGDGPAARARALGIPAEEVDGNDIVAVDETARRLIGDVRAGGGPRFLVARTYRLTGHTGVDPATYRPSEEVAARWKDDPIARLGEALRAAGLGQDALDAERAAAADEIARVYDMARDTPWPPASRAYEDVQDAGDPRVAAF
jgi:pyruvate dehydrogenase E1 component alpha subunit